MTIVKLFYCDIEVVIQKYNNNQCCVADGQYYCFPQNPK